MNHRPTLIVLRRRSQRPSGSEGFHREAAGYQYVRLKLL